MIRGCTDERKKKKEVGSSERHYILGGVRK
jgi:hypothetical protein